MLIRLHDLLLIQTFQADFLRVSACSDTLASITKLIESRKSSRSYRDQKREISLKT